MLARPRSNSDTHGTQIKFGTDGWRGIIADDFTFDNVRRVGNAMATYVHKNEDVSKGLVVGYDTRFASKQPRRSSPKCLPAREFRYGCRTTTRLRRRCLMR